MKLVWGGKIVQSLPNFDFPEDLSLSTCFKPYSHIAKSIKLIKVIIFHRWILMFSDFQLAQAYFRRH